MPSRPTVPTAKRLFVTSGNRFAFPGCTLSVIDRDTGTVPCGIYPF